MFVICSSSRFPYVVFSFNETSTLIYLQSTQFNTTDETYLLTKFRECFGSSSDDSKIEKSRTEIELEFVKSEHEDLESRLSGGRKSSSGLALPHLKQVFDVAIDVETAK